MAELIRTKQDSDNQTKKTNTTITVKTPIEEPSTEVEKVSIEETSDFKVPTLEEINEKLLSDDQKKELDDGKKEVLEFLKEAQEENEISSDTIKDYNERINKRINAISDSTYETLVDNIIEQSNVPFEERPKYRTELLKRIKEQQAIGDEFEEAKNTFNEAVAQMQTEMDAMFTNMEYCDLIAKIDGLIGIAKKHNQGKAVDYYEKLREEVDSILHLTRMKNFIPKYKNPVYVIEGGFKEEDYNREYDKFFRILGNSKEYKFVDPSKLKESLENFLPEERKDNATIFMFALYRMINNGKIGVLDKNAVFLEGIFRVIYSLNVPDGHPMQQLREHERDEFINSLYEFIDKLKEKAEDYKKSRENK